MVESRQKPQFAVFDGFFLFFEVIRRPGSF